MSVSTWQTADGRTHFKIEVDDRQLREFDRAELAEFQGALATMRDALGVIARLTTDDGGTVAIDRAMVGLPQPGQTYPAPVTDPGATVTITETKVTKNV